MKFLRDNWLIIAFVITVIFTVGHYTTITDANTTDLINVHAEINSQSTEIQKIDQTTSYIAGQVYQINNKLK